MKNFRFPPNDQFHGILTCQGRISIRKGGQQQKKHSTEALIFTTWARNTICLLRRIHKLINESLSSWENFFSGDVHYFWNEDTSTNICEPAAKALIAINATFTEMKPLRRDLEDLIGSLNGDITRDVRKPSFKPARLLLIGSQLSLFFAHENNQMGIIQQNTSRDVKMLSVSNLRT